jgi:uncharacterized protein (DUF1499 family)
MTSGSRKVAVAGILFIVSLFSCAGKRPSNLGVSDGQLAPCSSAPNCVSSDAADADHAIAPLRLAKPSAEAWRIARDAVSALPRTHVLSDRDGYLHAECRSAVFGFVDDLELHLRDGEGIIAVRSASRIGYSDLGVNRRRVEKLRSLLVEKGAVE